jgi:hypothetical protein
MSRSGPISVSAIGGAKTPRIDVRDDQRQMMKRTTMQENLMKLGRICTFCYRRKLTQMLIE